MRVLVSLIVLVLGVCFGSNLLAADGLPRFEAQTIDAQVEIGYGLATGDVDGDGRTDILLADKTQFVWYRNPDWQRFVMIENLTAQDNVCIAARDIDGDGRVEVAVGGNWNPSDTTDSGSVHYLIAPEDPAGTWEAVALPHEPTVHRMHWVKLAERRYVLVVSPLHGRGNRNGEGAGARLIAYERPADPRQPWATTVLDDTLHMTHNLDPVQWEPSTVAEELLYIGREGAMVLAFDDERWSSTVLPRIEGGGEIRLGLLAPKRPYVATIEAMHGDRLVLYSALRSERTGDGAVITDRIVLDDNLSGGHAIAAADLLMNGQQQIVAGWRLPNRDQRVGLRLYYPTDERGAAWESVWIDENGMATEDVRTADLDGDGRTDIIAAGRQTKNVKIYWNRP